jgi:mannose-1-phosphate guanylyltransferase/mannose-6-phosphate isomerase
MLHAVILAGGGGTRLWPLSRAAYPKQFLKLLGEHTLLQQTILRMDDFIPPQRVWVVTGVAQEAIVRAQLSLLPSQGNIHVLGEPLSRNTAAAIGLAALRLQEADPDAVMVVLPADHWIARPEAFVSLLQSAVAVARRGLLVTLGIVPDQPASGYGYLQRGKSLKIGPKRKNFVKVYHVSRFIEKPEVQEARRYLDSGDYYWNAGIFVWRAATILEEIATHLPLLSQGLAELAQSHDQENATDVLNAVYERLDSISIDYGVLEKSSRLVVTPADIGWSDLGEWGTIHRLSRQDDRGNVLSPNVIAIDSENSFVYGARRTIATIGLKNTVVVDADDALLICPADRAQEVRTVVHQLQQKAEDLAQFSRTVHRPWGTYTILEESPQFKVKRLMVYPGAALSLQLHHHRSEHWVVVAGVAAVRNGDLEVCLAANQSTYIPAGTKHRLANPESEPLEVIEVQTGDYFGEDDIIRFDDLYHRTILRKKEQGT